MFLYTSIHFKCFFFFLFVCLFVVVFCCCCCCCCCFFFVFFCFCFFINFKVMQTKYWSADGHLVIAPSYQHFQILSKPVDQWKPNFKQSLRYSTISILVLYDLITVFRRSVLVTIRTQVYGCSYTGKVDRLHTNRKIVTNTLSRDTVTKLTISQTNNLLKYMYIVNRVNVRMNV